MKLTSLLSENLFREHDWQGIIKHIGGKFIHMHPDRNEVEMMYNGKHVLMEHESGKIKMFLVTDLTEAEDGNDGEIIHNIKEALDEVM